MKTVFDIITIVFCAVSVFTAGWIVGYIQSDNDSGRKLAENPNQDSPVRTMLILENRCILKEQQHRGRVEMGYKNHPEYGQTVAAAADVLIHFIENEIFEDDVKEALKAWGVKRPEQQLVRQVTDALKTTVKESIEEYSDKARAVFIDSIDY